MGGLPVDATADITNTGSTFTVTLTNLEANPTSVSQNLTDLDITFQNPAIPVGLTNTAAQRVVLANGMFVSIGTISGDFWSSKSGASSNTVLISNNSGPARTIIGPPGPGNIYSSGGTLSGFNPFLTTETSQFSVLPSPITGVTFSFGTTPGNDVAGVLASVPEPNSLILLGMGFVGLVGAARRRGLRGLVRRQGT